MPNPIEQLLKALRDDKWVAKLAGWIPKMSTRAVELYNDDPGDPLFSCKGQWGASVRMAMDEGGDVLGEFFRAVEESMSPPRIITSTELYRAFEVYIREGIGFIGGDFKEVYEHFLDHVEHRMLAPRNSNDFEVCRLETPNSSLSNADFRRIYQMGRAQGRAEILGTEPGMAKESPSDHGVRPQEENSLNEIVLWSGNRIHLACHFIHYEPMRWDCKAQTAIDSASGVLNARFEGRISPDGMRLLAEELLPVLRSVFRSAIAVSGSSNLDAYRQGYTGWPDWSGVTLPEVWNFKQLRQYLPFVRGCCETLFEAHAKKKRPKDTMDKRIANAVRLLCESDGQSNAAISLSLSVTALEALLGRNGPEISTTLANNIAVLLESRLDYRSFAVKFVKELYDQRSRVLHGETFDGEENGKGQSRRLAAGVLFGVWNRRDFLSKMQLDVQSPEELLKELQEHTYMSGLPDGALDVPEIRSLWEINQKG
jgi:Apea-like HEPN